jgi:hypothetical protein
LAIGFLGAEVVENFDEGHLFTRSGRSRGHGLLNGLFSARAARLGLVFNIASGLLANEFTLRTRAGGGLSARPRAFGFFAQRSAVGFRGNAGGVAFSRGANSFALGAVILFTHIFRATDRAFGLLAVDSALGALGLEEKQKKKKRRF